MNAHYDMHRGSVCIRALVIIKINVLKKLAIFKTHCNSNTHSSKTANVLPQDL